MRNSRKFLTLMLAVLMIMSTFAFSSSASFTDVSKNDEALSQAVGLLSYLGVTKGTTETTFSPETLVTREQMAAFVYRLMKAGRSVEGGVNTSTFEDLTDPTFFFMVSWANNQGVIKGRSQTSFDPSGHIVLQDAYTMIVRALGYEDEENVPYPYGHIDIAEDLGLDKNLPSSLSYTDPLSRGDIALLLYNAFFADMAKGETAQKYEQVGTTGAFITTPVTVYKTVAEKIFNVEKDTQRVVATPGFYLNEREIDTDFDQDVLLFDGTASYRTFEELDLPGEADDYFLSDFNLYLKQDTRKDGTVETLILYAEPLLVKTTATSAQVSKVTPTKDSDYYYVSGTTRRHAKATGLVTVDNVKMYLYDAPYSYAKPALTPDIVNDATEYYNALNEKNVEFIGLAPEVEEGITTFYTSDYAKDQGVTIFGLPEKTGTGSKAGFYDASIFTNALNQMYSGGYYEIDLYDSDGDGIIDFAWYKPYTFGQVIQDDKFSTFSTHVGTTEDSFSAIDVAGVPTIYTYNAVVEGASYKNKDFVVAYVNGPANYIKVAAVVPSVRAELKSYNNANKYVVLSNGSNAATNGVNRLLAYYFSGGVVDAEEGTSAQALDSKDAYEGLYSAANLGKEQSFYIYGGKLIYTDAVVRGEYSTDSTILIPLDEYTRTTIISDSTGFPKSLPVLDAYVSSPVNRSTIIAVEHRNNDPETGRDSDGRYDFGEYKDRLVTFSVDIDNIYTLQKVVTAENSTSAAEALLLDKEEGAQFGVSRGYSSATDLHFIKVTGRTYQFQTSSEVKADVHPNTSNYLSIQPYTQIIVKSIDEYGDVIFTEFGYDKLPNFTNSIEKMEMLVINNPNSVQTEYIGALYIELSGEMSHGTEVGATENVRIVTTNQTVDVDSDGNYRYYYDIINPFTGDKAKVPGFRAYANASNLTSASAATVGKLYEVIDGKLQDSKTAALGNVELFNNNGNRVPSSDIGLMGAVAGLVKIANVDNDIVEILGDDNIYRTDSSTSVLVLKAGGDNFNDFKWAASTVRSVADLASGSSTLKNYADVTEANNRVVTKYAEDIEAFVAIDPAKTSTSDNYKVIDFIVVLVSKVAEEDLGLMG